MESAISNEFNGEGVFAMKHFLDRFLRVVFLVLTLYFWLWLLDQRLSTIVDIAVIVGGILSMIPIGWFGRKFLDKEPTPDRAARGNAFVHFAVVILIGVSIVRALNTLQDWPDWSLPVPTEIGLLLVFVTGSASLLAVANLALKGLGAPFAISLSRKLAVDWMYAWTRNPMVLATLAFGVSLGIWFQSTLFVLWVLVLFAPSLLFLVRVYEERELEIRFGAVYLEYKSRTPFLFPRKPKS